MESDKRIEENRLGTIGLIVGERLKVRGKERETIGLIERERTKTEGIDEKRDKLPESLPTPTS